MNIIHRRQKPEVASNLTFTETEVKEALIEYAKRNGCDFLIDEEVVFRYRKGDYNIDSFELTTKCSGITPGIIKSKRDVWTEEGD